MPPHDGTGRRAGRWDELPGGQEPGTPGGERGASTGRWRFVARHGLWDDAQHGAADHARRVITERGIDLVRMSFPDIHGVLRGKTLTVDTFAEHALRDGHTVPSTLILKDTSGRTAFPVFRAGAGIGMPELTGVADIVLVPDPATFRVLPWAPRTAWVLCDIFFPDGRPVTLSPRHLYRALLAEAAARGYGFVAGLEVEFHVFRIEDPMLDPGHAGWPGEPPRVRLLSHGYQLVAEDRIDQLDDVVQLICGTATGLGLPLRSIELELGPSQLEATFAPQQGLAAADTMVLFRSAVKQVCRRHGYHATFMCRPNLPSVASSGWHLHQSLRDQEAGTNAFTPSGPQATLSETGRRFLGGLLAHAAAAMVFTTPTINGYKRYRPYSLAPDRVVWGVDNKGAMVRVISGPDEPGTRLENRCAEPAANPYLAMASQLASGLDGLDRHLDPGDPTDEPYDSAAPKLPASLDEAVRALEADKVLATYLGKDLVDHVTVIKRAEIARFAAAVTDWEHREYFDLF